MCDSLNGAVGSIRTRKEDANESTGTGTDIIVQIVDHCLSEIP